VNSEMEYNFPLLHLSYVNIRVFFVTVLNKTWISLLRRLGFFPGPIT